MPKRKKQRETQTSRGSGRSVAKRWCKDTRSEGQRLLDAWDSWIKGCPTPRILQRELNVSKGTLYRNWLIMNSPKRRREEIDA